MTLSKVSSRHPLSGLNLSAQCMMCDEHTDLNSGSGERSTNRSNSAIMERTLLWFTSATHNSMARRLMDTSGSLRHSRMVER